VPCGVDEVEAVEGQVLERVVRAVLLRRLAARIGEEREIDLGLCGGELLALCGRIIARRSDLDAQPLPGLALFPDRDELLDAVRARATQVKREEEVFAADDSSDFLAPPASSSSKAGAGLGVQSIGPSGSVNELSAGSRRAMSPFADTSRRSGAGRGRSATDRPRVSSRFR
jgi:hypothetical protein